MKRRLKAWWSRIRHRLANALAPCGKPLVPMHYTVFAEAVDYRSSRDQWVAFAAGLAAQAYNDGYRAGFEYMHRQSAKHRPPLELPKAAPAPSEFAVYRGPYQGIPPERIPEMVERVNRAYNNGVQIVAIDSSGRVHRVG